MILRNKEWWRIRNPEKYEYNKMCEELNAYTIKNYNNKNRQNTHKKKRIRENLCKTMRKIINEKKSV